MAHKAGTKHWRKDYQAPDFIVTSVELDFDLQPEHTLVRSKLEILRRPGATSSTLSLDGEDLELQALSVNGQAVLRQAWALRTDGGLDVRLGDAERATVEMTVRIRPEQNSSLSGLYLSRGMYCTQCEAEGFRRITFFPDRPDVMARFRVRVAADLASCSVLLSNGDRIESGSCGAGRHYAIFVDPFPKPSYLFALVAGSLRDLHEVYLTPSGRRVDLHLWSEPENLPRLSWAMACLKRAMRWDEEVFGLEYDLSTFHVVATRDFNMGAMENKGLNVFNASYLLAAPATATDEDHEVVEGVVAHEYFHNWTGNRVTCRDWFQLTLKEGLTVYRDQRFSSELRSAAVKRIEDVRMLRERQFPEDSGPLAHPIRPDAYEAMDNFYTSTVYLKGAEVIRLYETLLGKPAFRRGMDLYFQRHDGSAVTCDDFRAALCDAAGQPLPNFERWYAQAGTPLVEAMGSYEPAKRRYRLRLRQSTAATPGQDLKLPVPIPVAAGLMGASGHELAATRILLLQEAEQEFIFDNLDERPIPSLLRDFSAPVRLQLEQSDADLAVLLAHDTDSFNRWEAGQRLASRTLLAQASDIQAGRPPRDPEALAEAGRCVLQDEQLDPSLAAYALSLPDEGVLAEEMLVQNPAALRAARHHTERFLARSLRNEMEARVRGYHRSGAYLPEPAQIGPRRLRNRCLDLLGALNEAPLRALCLSQWRSADNLSDARAAVAALCRHPGADREQVLAEARRAWSPDPATLDQWFQVQSASTAPDTLQRVIVLCGDPDFTLRNPNRARALLRGFVRNHGSFHAADGAGYRLLADRILEIDPLNPGLAAGLVKALAPWRRYGPLLGGAMRKELERIGASAGLSKNSGEVIRLALADLQSVPA